MNNLYANISDSNTVGRRQMMAANIRANMIKIINEMVRNAYYPQQHQQQAPPPLHMQQSYQYQIQQLQALNHRIGILLSVLESILGVVVNILTHPSEEKYRYLDPKKPEFKNSIGRLRGGMELFRTMGFDIAIRRGQEFFGLPFVDDGNGNCLIELNVARETLNEIIAQLRHRQQQNLQQIQHLMRLLQEQLKNYQEFMQPPTVQAQPESYACAQQQARALQKTETDVEAPQQQLSQQAKLMALGEEPLQQLLPPPPPPPPQQVQMPAPQTAYPGLMEDPLVEHQQQQEVPPPPSPASSLYPSMHVH
eukprot:GEZU01038791.1.p1 GENE.GEZU01038791.1~~GEZU01038791.1.p1  ORF type:complete len:307 (+),score=98.21 GEZU01038791.1:212-1132(+)